MDDCCAITTVLSSKTVILQDSGWCVIPTKKSNILSCSSSFVYFSLLGSLCLWYDIIVHDEHELLLQREEIWNHQLQVGLHMFSKTLPFSKSCSSLSHTSLMLCATEKRGPKLKMRKRAIGKRGPEDQGQRKGLQIPSKIQEKLSPLQDLLQRASHLQRKGVPQFHVTRDSDTLLHPKALRRSIISLSWLTIRSAGRARSPVCFPAWGRTQRWDWRPRLTCRHNC